MSEPDTIGRYRVLGSLGAGGFASVYLADDPRLDAKVAIKLLSERMAADGSLRSRFIEEARVMRRLAGSGLVTVHDIDEYDNRPYFVMEHCARGTLADRLSALGRPLTLDEGIGLAAALSAATAGIHRSGVVHRDLKPSNYLIRETPTDTRNPLGALLQLDEELVVADFGLAKTVNLDATRLSIAGGTPGYGAPEQFAGDPSVDATADVYALSAILVSALSGEQPQPVLAPGARAFTPAAFAAAGPLAPVLARGLSLDRNDRYRDVTDWHQALTTATAHHGRNATVVAPDPPQPPPRSEAPTQHVEAPHHSGPATPGRDAANKQRRGPITLLALLAVVVVVGAGLAAFMTGAVTLPGPTVHGPTSGAAGDEAVFAIDSADAYDWAVNGDQAAVGRIISLTPEPGTYEITASTGFRSTTITYIVTDLPATLRIDGPGLAPVGQATRLTGTGPNAAELVWTIAGQESVGTTIDLRPSGPGVIDVQVTAGDGERVRRTITASEILG